MVVQSKLSVCSDYTPPPGYELERKDRPGLIVDVNSTLENQGTMDFMLVKHIGMYSTQLLPHFRATYVHVCELPNSCYKIDSTVLCS